jgi:hypothetical protein
MTPRQIREAAGLTLIAAAVGANKAENTVRTYEANPDFVSKKSRRELDAYYATLVASAVSTEAR